MTLVEPDNVIMIVMKKIQTIGIIGLGKFSQLLISYLLEADKDLQIKISSRSNAVDNLKFFEIKEVCECDVVIPAVPVKYFEECIKNISGFLNPKTIVMDVCSVKVHPKKIMLENIPKNVEIICTHPNFGPESYFMNGNKTNGLNYIVENVRCSKQNWEWFLTVLNKLDFNIIEMEAETHDQKVGIPHFTSMLIGILLNRLEMKRIDIGAASTIKMFDMADGVGKDFDILRDMYKFNPFAKKHLEDLKSNMQDVVKEINL